MGSFPPTYLELPLCIGHTYKTIWNSVIEKVERKFSMESELSFFRWQDSCYSFCIVKPLNLLHVFAQMSGLCGQSHWEATARLHLEGGGSIKKYHLLDCNSVCKSKKEQGLGFRPLRQMNHAHWGKWLWRVGEDGESLWKQVILAKCAVSRNGWDIPSTLITALWDFGETSYLWRIP